jgi:hypothetical protein
MFLELNQNAFLPPPKANRFDESVLRHAYTTDDFCKNHSSTIQIGEAHSYIGLALVRCSSISIVNNNSYKLDNGESVTVKVIATPNPNGIDLPLHADIFYSHSLIDEEPKTTLRMISKAIIELSKFVEDPAPKSKNWTGAPLASNF